MEVHIHIDDRLVDAVKTLTRSFTRRRIAAIASLSIVASSFVADAAPVEDLVEFHDGDTIEADKINDNFDKLRTAVDTLFIREDKTISVANCVELIAELYKLEEARILSDASVTIEIATGTHACPRTVDVSHVDGERLSIVGAGDEPSDVKLTFVGFKGFSVEGSRELGLLSNLTLIGIGTDDSTAVRTDRGASLTAERVVSQGFVDAFRANSGATMTLTDCEAVGIYVANRPESNQGAGFSATRNSTLILTDCTAESFRDGVSASELSLVAMTGTITLATNGREGIHANRLAFIGTSSGGAVVYENNADDVPGADNGAIVMD